MNDCEDAYCPVTPEPATSAPLEPVVLGPAVTTPIEPVVLGPTVSTPVTTVPEAPPAELAATGIGIESSILGIALLLGGALALALEKVNRA